jgi:hypothetical protein
VKERIEKERKGKERKGKERKGKERGIKSEYLVQRQGRSDVEAKSK